MRAAIAEEQPAAARQAVRPAMMEKRAERRDAGARADHDHRRSRILRQAKSRVSLHVHRRLRPGGEPVREPCRCDAAAAPAATLITHARDGQMYLLRKRRLA